MDAASIKGRCTVISIVLSSLYYDTSWVELGKLLIVLASLRICVIRLMRVSITPKPSMKGDYVHLTFASSF
jgi:hypothetical protein